jgi:HSP20 family protein
MPEVQQPTSERPDAPRKGDGTHQEPRSFEGGRRPPPAVDAADAIAAVAQPLAEGSRQMAEQGRRAGREALGAWRQAMDPLLAMQFDMGRWFDDVFRQTFGFHTSPASRPMGHFSPASLLGLPPAEMKETETALTVAIELPGLAKEDIDISLQGDNLVVCGHKSEESADANATFRVSERRYGRFERVFPLPPEVERGQIEAQFKDGVLRVTLPKTPTAAAPHQRIEIRG